MQITKYKDALELAPVQDANPQRDQLKRLLSISSKSDSEDTVRQLLNEYLLSGTKKLLFKVTFEDQILGIIGVEQLEHHRFFIRHIAVEPDIQWKGVGKFMIERLPKHLPVKILETEVDELYVGFFRECGFDAFPEPYEKLPCRSIG